MTGLSVRCELFATLLASALAVAIVLSPNARDAAHWLVASALGLLTIWIVLQDLSDFTIPDGAVIAVGLLGAAHRIAQHDGSVLPLELPMIAFDGVLAGGGLFAIREAYFRSRGRDGIGFGDVKLAGVGGVLVGSTGFALALFAASIAGIAYSAYRSRRNRGADFTDRIAFGAFLAPALSALWMAQRSPALAAFVG